MTTPPPLPPASTTNAGGGSSARRRMQCPGSWAFIFLRVRMFHLATPIPVTYRRAHRVYGVWGCLLAFALQLFCFRGIGSFDLHVLHIIPPPQPLFLLGSAAVPNNPDHHLHSGKSSQGVRFDLCTDQKKISPPRRAAVLNNRDWFRITSTALKHRGAVHSHILLVVLRHTWRRPTSPSLPPSRVSSISLRTFSVVGHADGGPGCPGAPQAGHRGLDAGAAEVRRDQQRLQLHRLPVPQAQHPLQVALYPPSPPPPTHPSARPPAPPPPPARQPACPLFSSCIEHQSHLPYIRH